MSLVNNRTDIHLEHYGTKGMKWGVRKARKSSARKKASSSKMKKTLSQKISSFNTPKNKQTVKKGAIITGLLVAAVGATIISAWAEGAPARARARSAVAGLQRNIDANTVRDINRLFTGGG